MKRIKYCNNCGTYTLKETCGTCGRATIINAPVKYSPDQSVAKYRREAKKEYLKQKG